MKNIQKSFRHSHKFGARCYAVVETLKLGKATVRTVGSNARMTNLNVVGTGIVEGDHVYVEYGGIKPVVKPAGSLENEVLLLLSSGGSIGDARKEGEEDFGARAYRSTNTTVPWNTWTTVEYDNVDWDTSNIWSPAAPERFTAPVNGFYMVIFHWAWQKTNKRDYTEWGAVSGSSIDVTKFLDWKPNEVRVMHSAYNDVYKANDCKPFYDKLDTKDSLMFTVYMLGGDYIYAQAITRNSYSANRTLVGSTLYPRLTMQFRSYV